MSLPTLPAPERDDPGEPDAAPEHEGAVLEGRYELGAVIARGGMGVVYAARHVVLGTRLAVKVLRHELGRDASAVSRFRREARAASALGHPHIVDVRDFGTMDDGSSYFVMERLDGRDLADELAGRGALAPSRAIGIALQILDALAAAHRSGIVHRDLKPENVFLVDRGPSIDHVKVLDFGVAKVLDESFARTLRPDQALASAATGGTQGQALGTPAYMAPEQWTGHAIDGRTDLYALGIVLYEMVTGELPFDHEDARELMRLHGAAAPLPPSELAPIPRALEEVILRCLAKDPEARFARAEEVTAALSRLAAPPTPPSGAVQFSRRERATPAGPAERAQPARAARAPSHPWKIVLAIALAVLGLLGLGGALFVDWLAHRAAGIAQPPAITTAPPVPPATGAEPQTAPSPETATSPETAFGAAAPAAAAPDERNSASSDGAPPTTTEALPGSPPRGRRRTASVPAPGPAPAPATDPAPAPDPIPPSLRPMLDPWGDTPL